MMHDHMTIKECFLFDAGNTLLRLNPSREELLLKILKTHGMETTLGKVKLAFMMNDHMMNIGGFTILSKEKRWQYWKEYTENLLNSTGLPLEEIDGVTESISGAFCSPKSWIPFYDVKPTLEKLRDSGCVMAIVSNAEHCLYRTLEIHDLAQYFETVVISEEVRVEKPDPLIFQEALTRLNIPPEKCVHTGDMMDADVRGARESGITPVWLDRQQLGKYTPEILRISTLTDLPVMFRLPGDGRVSL
ncbi:MAG: HAD-IA family hydrolase [Methanomassiliicoccales archaeon]|nr:HAD-IA family hydrolase [Methanomassiliicoccales archaeon]